MTSGIYQIKNTLNDKRYIGSAVNTQQRWAVHLSTLRSGQHHNEHLQRAFDKYGEEVFLFAVIEYIEKSEQLIPHEQYYFDTLKPEYNIAPIAGSSLGVRLSEETCKRLGESRTGRCLSDKHRRNISKALTGERNPMYGKHHSDETKQKISASLSGERNPNYGKHPSAETRAKQSEAWTLERRQAQSDKQRGRHHSAETKQKLRVAQIGRHHTEESKRKMRVAKTGKRSSFYGKHHTEESKRKMSIARIAYWRRKRAEEQ